MTTAQSCFRIFICCSLLVPTIQCFSAEANPEKGVGGENGSTLQLSIDKEQRLLADQFTKLEEVFIKLADVEGSANPTRAGLLRQAAQLSKQLATQQRLNIAVDYLAKGQLTRALQEQEAARDNLQKLLELLQRENRGQRLRDEREKIQELIKEAQRIARLQRSLRGRTESGQEMSEAKQEQESLKNETSKVGEALKEANKSQEPKPEESSSKPADSKSEQSGGDQQSKDEDKSSGEKNEDSSKPKDGEQSQSPQDGNQAEKDGQEKSSPQDGKQSDKNGNPNSQDKQSTPNSQDQQSPSPSQDQGQQSQSPSQESQQPQEGQQSQGQQSQGQDGQQSQGQQSQKSNDSSKQQQQPQSPEQKAQERVQRARDRMQQAQEKLQQENRQDAVQEQREAERELAAAVEELESVLRQMREEEVERSLANLESRFRKMLTMQTEILKQTEKYASVEGGLDERQIELQSVKLSIEEQKILMEGQRAMLLLEEEGSSMAFPEAVEQLNSDISLIVGLFKSNRLDESNVQLQQQVVATLEELLESLTAVQKDKEKKKEQKKQQQGEAKQQSQQSQDLVDKLAELRLIRTLQVRINKRTVWLANQNGSVDDPLGQVQDPVLSQQARELAERQERLENVLRDIILQKGQKE